MIFPSFSTFTLVAAVTASSAKKLDSAPKILLDIEVLAGVKIMKGGGRKGRGERERRGRGRVKIRTEG